MTQHCPPKDRRFEIGDVILSEETEARCLYIIKRGRVRVSKRSRSSNVVLGELGPGNMFGEMALIDRHMRSATVVAIEPTMCIELPYQLVNDQVERAGPWVAAMLRILVLRLRMAGETAAGRRKSDGDTNSVPIDAVTQRHLNKIVRKLEGTQAIAWERRVARADDF